MTNWNQIFAESDRGCIIVALAMIDEELASLLGSDFKCEQPDFNTIKRELFENMGPLHSVSAKAKCACAFGYISKDIYTDFTLLNKIRNRFAHFNEPASFDDSPIHDLLRKLSLG